MPIENDILKIVAVDGDTTFKTPSAARGTSPNL
jgi:hypothetical protein